MKQDSEPTDNIAQTLRQALNTSGKTIEEVANDLGVHRNTVHRWLKGESQPRGLMRGPLAKAFGISPAEIWPNIEAPAPDMEVVETWKHLQDIPTETWVDLVQDTTAKEINVLAGSGTRLTEGVPRLDEIIRAHDVFGAKIRICFGDPKSEHTTYRDTEEGLDGTFSSRIQRSILEWKRILEGLENAELRVYEPRTSIEFGPMPATSQAMFPTK